MTASLGVMFKDDGTVSDVVPGKVAHKAGVGPGMKVLAVSVGLPYFLLSTTSPLLAAWAAAYLPNYQVTRLPNFDLPSPDGPISRWTRCPDPLRSLCPLR